jgi:hypothetical protein
MKRNWNYLYRHRSNATWPVAVNSFSVLNGDTITAYISTGPVEVCCMDLFSFPQLIQLEFKDYFVYFILIILSTKSVQMAEGWWNILGWVGGGGWFTWRGGFTWRSGAHLYMLWSHNKVFGVIFEATTTGCATMIRACQEKYIQDQSLPWGILHGSYGKSLPSCPWGVARGLYCLAKMKYFRATGMIFPRLPLCLDGIWLKVYGDIILQLDVNEMVWRLKKSKIKKTIIFYGCYCPRPTDMIFRVFTGAGAIAPVSWQALHDERVWAQTHE